MLAVDGGRITSRFTAVTSAHQRTVGRANTRAYSNQEIGRPAFAKSPAMNGPQSEPVSTAHPGRTAISNAPSTMRAAPRLGSGSLIACTRANAIGTMMAVRTVIEGTPRVSTNPMTMNADRIPRYVGRKIRRISYEMRRASPVLSIAVPKNRTLTRIQNAPVAKPPSATFEGTPATISRPSASNAVMPTLSTSVTQNTTASAMTASADWPTPSSGAIAG